MMTTPVCRVVIPESIKISFPLVREIFESIGCSLVNPLTKSITSWTDEGVQVKINENILMQEIVSGALRNIQFWRSAGDDVFVSWEACADDSTFSIFLNGTEPDFAARLVGEFVKAELSIFRKSFGDKMVLSLAFE